MRRHKDDIGVDHFALAMRLKLRNKRAEGKYGWDDPLVCSMEELHEMLNEHIAKGDPVDIANFCMMIWNREHADGKGE